MAVGHNVKRRRLSPPGDGEGKSSRGASNGDAEWDVEQDYERRPRKLNKKEKEHTRLPIKTSEGVQRLEEVEPEIDEDDSFLGTDDDEYDGEEPQEIIDDDDEEEEEEEQPKIPLKVQIVQAKEQIARIATLINEDPEEQISSFKTIAEMADNGSHVAIQKLALASQVAIYKDVIPGYRIRSLGEDDMSSKVSKEVRKIRKFEQTLLGGYKNLIHKLQVLTSPSSKKDQDQVDPGLRSVAISCACNLLLGVPHFNFRGELLKIVVNRLAKKQVDADFNKCRETLEDVFAKDTDGVVSLEAVRLLTKMMRAKEYRINEGVLNTFLHLRLLSEFSSKASADRVDKPEDNTVSGKKQKQKREFRTKRERKVEKERKVVEKDMKEADALVSHEAREKSQAETLKLVFGNYFRILKLRTQYLMGPVLEGLAKYAHLINQDFFGDLLEALKDLIGHADRDEAEDDMEQDEDESNAKPKSSKTRDSYREALLCTVTAFALLEGQDATKVAATLHLDLSFFIKHLYRSLYTYSINPDIEFNPSKALRLPDPDSHEGDDESAASQQRSKNKVNFQTPTVLLLRCLQSTLLSRAHGIPPPIRVGSFTKRLMTTALQVPEKSAIASLSLLNQVAKHNARRIAPLWNSEERKGDGVFNPYSPDIEATNVFAGNVWEGELLRLHYCPQVRETAVNIEKIIAAR